MNWFHYDGLSEMVSPGTKRRLKEYFTHSLQSEKWYVKIEYSRANLDNTILSTHYFKIILAKDLSLPACNFPSI